MASLPQALRISLSLFLSGILSNFAADYHIDQPVITVIEGASQGGVFSVTGEFRAVDNQTLTNAVFELAGNFALPTSNHAPAAMPESFTRLANGDIKIEIQQLLANDFDPDGYHLNIEIPSTTAAGVPLQVSGGWIFYLHASALSDHFIYSVTDGFGAKSQGRVDILIRDPNSQFSTLLRINTAGGAAQIHFTGILNRVYTIQGRDTLDDPWVDLGSASSLGLGQFRFTDSGGGATRFYRVVYRP